MHSSALEAPSNALKSLHQLPHVERHVVEPHGPEQIRLARKRNFGQLNLLKFNAFHSLVLTGLWYLCLPLNPDGAERGVIEAEAGCIGMVALSQCRDVRAGFFDEATEQLAELRRGAGAEDLRRQRPAGAPQVDDSLFNVKVLQTTLDQGIT